jgi:hypothetical protein
MQLRGVGDDAVRSPVSTADMLGAEPFSFCWGDMLTMSTEACPVNFTVKAEVESMYLGPNEAAGRVGSWSMSDSQRGRVVCLYLIGGR